MTIRWTKPANDDFLGIVAWIAANDPAAASRVGQRILDAVQHLEDFPLLGRPGRSPGTRERLPGNDWLHKSRRVGRVQRQRNPPKRTREAAGFTRPTTLTR